MNSLLSKSFAVALGLASAFALTPAMAAPAFHLAPGAVPDASPHVIQVQNTPGSPQSGLDFYRDNRPGAYRNHNGYNGYNRGGHYQQRYDYNRRGRHYRDRSYYRHRDRSYYRDRDNGAGVVGGLIAGAIIGGIASGALNNNGGNGGNAHVNWCHNRYRSYRAYDNTFQPYNGPRRQCVSPY